MTSNPQSDKLQDEIHFGEIAKRAHDSFIKPFIEGKRITLFTNFCSASMENPAVLMEIKRMMIVLDDLEAEVETVINTGKMAAFSLAEEDK